MSATYLGRGAQLRFAVDDMSRVGEVRRAAEQLAIAAGFSDVAKGRVAIVASELTTNLVRHAGSTGEILLQTFDDNGTPQIEVLSVDRGPGMDTERCLRDGFSTAGTAGNGLGAISRLATVFDLYSTAGHGTVVLARVANEAHIRPPGPPPGVSVGAVSRPVQGEFENGDTWRAAYDREHLAMFVADGLGHGPLAATASRIAADRFGEAPFGAPSESLQTFHRALAGTRGAAISLALMRTSARSITFAGVGNVSGVIVSEGKGKGMPGHNGTVGLTAPRTRSFDYPVPLGALIVMHSDGLQSRWSLADHPGLANRHPGVVAGVLYRDYTRQRDDVTVMVARCA